MAKQDIVFEFQKSLMPLTVEGVLSEMASPILVDMVGEALDQYSASVIANIEAKIREWEKNMFDDQTLYSLGLRHAVDIILEDDPYDRAAVLAKQYQRELEDGDNA